MSTNHKKFLDEIASKLDFYNSINQNTIDLDEVPLNSKSCIYVIDWKSGKVSYQRNIKEVLGYSKEEFTLDTILHIAHPEDLDLIKRITQAVVNHVVINNEFANNNPSLSITYRFRKKDGSYIKMLRQSTMLDKTEKGTMISNYSLLTDISFFDHSKNVKWEFDTSPEEHALIRNEVYKEFNAFFTNREIEIILLISKGLKTKEIAKELHISEHTVYAHRKNILKKSKCSNAKQLIEFCNKIGVLK